MRPTARARVERALDDEAVVVGDEAEPHRRQVVLIGVEGGPGEPSREDVGEVVRLDANPLAVSSACWMAS